MDHVMYHIVSPIEFLLWCGIYQLSLCILNPVDHMQSNIIFFLKMKKFLVIWVCSRFLAGLSLAHCLIGSPGQVKIIINNFEVRLSQVPGSLLKKMKPY